jgi:NADH:ubiquinone oxidoreductase subunit E
MNHSGIDLGQVESILRRHRHEKWGLIPVLQEIQETFGYIPPETIVPVADTLQIFPSQVQGVVKGGRSILRFIKRELGLDEGETSPDYQFTLETVACLGACFLAPTMMVNKTYYGRLSPPKVSNILKQYEKKE